MEITEKQEILDAIEGLGRDLREEIRVAREKTAHIEATVAQDYALIRGEVNLLKERVRTAEDRLGKVEENHVVVERATHLVDSMTLLRTETSARLDTQDGELAEIKTETRQQTALIRKIARSVITPNARRVFIVAIFIGGVLGSAYAGYQLREHNVPILPR